VVGPPLVVGVPPMVAGVWRVRASVGSVLCGARLAVSRSGAALVGLGWAELAGTLGGTPPRRLLAAPRSRLAIRRTARITSSRPAVPVNHRVMVP
jgi:hypothetical protein